ncbi:MAG: type IX secretion system sortase PorU [Schleiferiaceae bacterium]
MSPFRTFFLTLFVAASAGSTPIFAQSWPANSVLRSGLWAEVFTGEDQIYRLSGAELQQLGLGTAPFESVKLGVWGRAAGVLDEVNQPAGEARDLISLPVRVEDGGDGQLSATEYLYFLGQSPHAWSFDSTANRWLRPNHPYADQQTYFVTTTEGGSRIQTLSPPSGPVKQAIRFQHVAWGESDLVNLVGSGRAWFGEVLDYTLARQVDLGLSRLDAQSTARFVVSGAGRSTVFGPKMELRTGQGFVGSSTIQTVSGVNGDTYARQFTQSWSQVAVGSSWGTAELTLERSANPAAKAWIDYIGVQADAPWTFASGTTSAYRLLPADSAWQLPAAPAGTWIWRTTSRGSALDVVEVASASRVLGPQVAHTVWYITPSAARTPVLGAKIPNQNLHAMPSVDYVILTPAEFQPAAEVLAALHRSKGLKVAVVNVAQAYREFSGGVQDIMGLRNLLRMLWSRPADSTKLQYLLLFGDASYDYKGRLTPKQNWVPAYESPSSMSIKTSFVSDDFYGYLDQGEGGNLAASTLDLGIGRLPVNSLEAAQGVVAKLLRYADPEQSLGPWRQRVNFVTDDVDEDWEQVLTLVADRIAERVDTQHAEFDVRKLFADGYAQVSSAGNQSYPKLREDLLRSVEEGNLITTYVGHGGEVNWASEDILQIDDCRNFSNRVRLPLFITVTCEFSRYDDPLRISAGEELMVNPEGGAVALLTTTRAVFVGGATLLTDSVFNVVLQQDGGAYQTFGQIIKSAKNSVTAGDKLRFTLLGDPALRLNGPEQRIEVAEVEVFRPDSETWEPSDSLRALDLVRLRGRVLGRDGNLDTSFDGTARIRLFDKVQPKAMLDNDNVGYQASYAFRNQLAYQGEVDVRDGIFAAQWRMPLDLVLEWGKGKLLTYAQGGLRDAAGSNSSLMLGDLALDAPEDTAGPTLRVYMDDTNFVSGGITGVSPMGLVRLADPNGINAIGAGIGHDLVGFLDENWSEPLVMNDRYQADPNTYQRGTATWPFDGLTDGLHRFTVRAWDTYNNPRQASVDFVVVSQNQLRLGAVRLYPNPTPGWTTWLVEHNAAGDSLQVDWTVTDGSGRAVWAHQWVGVASSSVLQAPEWQATTPSGTPLPDGWYVAKVAVVRLRDGQKVHQADRLILIRP